MNTKIIERLKTGKIKNVIPFGTKVLPGVPYVVVRSEPETRGKVYRVFAHFAPGQNIFLEDYIFNDLSILLDGFEAQTRNGNYNKLLSLNEYGDIVSNNDDGSISMERRFLLPSFISL